MKKILLLLLVALSLFSCDKEEVDVPRQHAGRTVLAYFWADNNLNNNLLLNIGTMLQGLQSASDSTTLVVYWDGNSSNKEWVDPCILKFLSNGRGEINGVSAGTVTPLCQKVANIYDEYIKYCKGENKYGWLRDLSDVYSLLEIGKREKTYSSQISTDKSVMQMVVADMMACFPSESYGIVLGSHGSGWLPTLTGRSIGQDGAETNTIQIPDLAEALQAANPQKFDFVLFDACMMSHAEVYYQLRDATKYCFASVLDIPAGGFPYGKMMPYLYKNDIQYYWSAICDAYIDTYDGLWGTMSVVDCTQMETLAGATREVLLTYQNNLKKVNTRNLQEYGKKGNFLGNAYDMVHFMKSLCEGEAPAAFTEQFNKTVLYAGYVPNADPTYYKINGDNYCGMGMYIPNSSTSGKYKLWNDYFRNSIAWYQAAGWAETEPIWGK